LVQLLQRIWVLCAFRSALFRGLVSGKEGEAMYSMVLMAALSTGGDVPAFGRHGCYGGWGGGCYGCYGCCGCWGGGWGGCYGCYGCYGGWGGYAYGGWGSGYGYGYAYAAPVYAAPVVMSASAPRIEDTIVQAPPRKSARIVVDLPADAKLFVDDQSTRTRSASRRVFQSPSLEPGTNYSYRLRAELERDGKKYQQTKTINVRAGQETTAFFSEPGITQTARADR
jgi:uncharacterized protein (TIGR03000 family)